MMAETLGTLRLQRVVGRVRGRLHHSQAAPAGNNPIIVLVAQRLAFRENRGVRLVAVQKLVAELSDVSDLQYGVSQNLTLYRQIHVLDIWRAQSRVRVGHGRQPHEDWVGEIGRQGEWRLPAQRIGQAEGSYV